MAGHKGEGVTAGKQAGSDGFGRAFHSGDLAGEENLRTLAQLESGGKQCGRVDVRVAMNLTVAEELGFFHAWNHPKDAGLLGIAETILETDQVVGIGSGILLA